MDRYRNIDIDIIYRMDGNRKVDVDRQWIGITYALNSSTECEYLLNSCQVYLSPLTAPNCWIFLNTIHVIEQQHPIR